MKVEVHFESHDEIINNELINAKTNVYIAVAWINFEVYLTLFKTILANEVKLNIICSDNTANRLHQLKIEELIDKGAKIKLLKMPNSRNHMHHKFAVIDDHSVINGSFNWSFNATKSFENLMVLRDCPDVAREFIVEFKRLLKIETSSIQTLQKKKECKDKECKGELVNILVFSEKYSKHFELTGDLIEVCLSCRQYSRLLECIVDNQLPSLLNNYQNSSDEDDLVYHSINEQLRGYMNEKDIVHAVGRVSTGLDGYDNEYIQTNILWKNVFVGAKIPKNFEDQDFDVYYDNSYTI